MGSSLFDNICWMTKHPVFGHQLVWQMCRECMRCVIFCRCRMLTLHLLSFKYYSFTWSEGIVLIEEVLQILPANQSLKCTETDSSRNSSANFARKPSFHKISTAKTLCQMTAGGHWQGLDLHCIDCSDIVIANEILTKKKINKWNK
jgi:hypothetical protein